MSACIKFIIIAKCLSDWRALCHYVSITRNTTTAKEKQGGYFYKFISIVSQKVSFIFSTYGSEKGNRSIRLMTATVFYCYTDIFTVFFSLFFNSIKRKTTSIAF